MAKKSSNIGGTSLVIVESPAKARTISKFLGPNYTIEASIGHIRDLPQGAKEIPEQYKKEDWAYLGVDVNHDFEPVYVIPGRLGKTWNCSSRCDPDILLRIDIAFAPNPFRITGLPLPAWG